MSKDFPKSEEAGIRAPSDQAAKYGPVAGHVESTTGTAVVQDAHAKGKASPLDHAKLLGLHRAEPKFATVSGETTTLEVFSPQHMAAAALHGWDKHTHHEGKPIELSADDYKAALHAAYNPVTRIVDKDGKPGAVTDSHEAAAKGIPTVTDYEPHAAALSPHNGKQ